MASCIIHLAVAKELEKKLNITNKNDYYLGSIAPDLAKFVDEDRAISHFLNDREKDIPFIQRFIDKYSNYKSNDFDLGYIIHLYTDKYWKKDFIDSVISNNSVRLLDGTIINMIDKDMNNIIYSDYTNLNIQLIDEYELGLSLFYEEFKKPKTSIDEIPTDKLYILLNEIGVLIENTEEKKAIIFDYDLTKKFISDTVDKIYSKLIND